MAVHHRKWKELSLALHREIARRIRRNPELLTEVREGLVKDIRSGRFSTSLTDAMQECGAGRHKNAIKLIYVCGIALASL